MRILLDTNILIHREGGTVVRDEIGTLFKWIDRLKYEKLVHPGSIEEIKKHDNPKTVQTFLIKLGSYETLKTIAPDSLPINDLRKQDKSPNDILDTSLLNEVAAGRVDFLITEDRGIHRKAALLGISANVFTIDSFLEKVTAENPSLSDYKVLAVKKQPLGAIKLADPFFDSFRSDYPDFDKWFNRKADEMAYVCADENGNIVAFLFLKREGTGENYSDIYPPFSPAKRLKIGTMKVIFNGYKLGERFLKIAFDNALLNEVDEIYVTIFQKSAEQDRLYRLLEDWGFVYHGLKVSKAGEEKVLVRNFRPHFNILDPRRSFPYLSSAVRKFMVPIYPKYHTELLPDSILSTESAMDFVENRPNRNAISKVYISRSVDRDLKTGDIIVFYRTSSGDGPAHYTSVVTTLGIVQEVITNIPNFEEFLKLCRKRSVFSDSELKEQWNFKPYNRPFVVNFLYVYSLPRRPNLKELKDANIIIDAPRGFELISESGYKQLMEISNANPRLIVH